MRSGRSARMPGCAWLQGAMLAWNTAAGGAGDRDSEKWSTVSRITPCGSPSLISLTGAGDPSMARAQGTETVAAALPRRMCTPVPGGTGCENRSACRSMAVFPMRQEAGLEDSFLFMNKREKPPVNWSKVLVRIVVGALVGWLLGRALEMTPDTNAALAVGAGLAAGIAAVIRRR